MDIKVDYLSFTQPANMRGVGHGDEATAMLWDTLEAAGQSNLLMFLEGAQAIFRNGRGHYGAGVFFEDLNISIWWGGISDHILVEIAGVGCQALRDAGFLMLVVAAAAPRCTRIDIACDSAAFGAPAEFVAHGHNERFKSKSSITSDTGDTEYVGTTKSERFARIYRYHAPHPRAGITRVEMVSRSDYAKSVAEIVVREGVIAAAAALGASYKWKSPAWNLTQATDSRVKAKKHDHDGAERLRWLLRAVKPALIQSHKDGLIDLEEFFNQVWIDMQE